jgi:hypothetical protein
MNTNLLKDAILRIGEVSGIEGRKVYVKVDKNKNSSDLLFDGDIIKNVSVGSYVEIKKGFLSIIGKSDGEKLTEDTYFRNEEQNQFKKVNRNERVLTLSLVGYVDLNGRFVGGIKELPLIGNEAFILTEQKIHNIHNLTKDNSPLHIRIAKTDIEEISVDLPIDSIFNSHIAIFGNTGSGKSNTLAALYQGIFDLCAQDEKFLRNCKFFILDFNGEYVKPDCVTRNKMIYNLRTQDDRGDKIPMLFDELFEIETLSVLMEATEKTQKPFLKRALRFYKRAKAKANFSAYLKAVVQNKIKDVLCMANKDTSFKLLDYIEEILEIFVDEESSKELRAGIEYHNNRNGFFVAGTEWTFFNSSPDAILETNLYKATESIVEEKLINTSDLSQFNIFIHLQLVEDLFRYKVQNDHIYPVVNRIKAKQSSIERTFKVEVQPKFWGEHNCVVVNLHDVNLDMKKTIPLLLAKNIYNNHKKEDNKKSLNIIIDEAHNILSKTSFRETEEWKDYRLETFEEIIKEGRKFGVFVTIASQRPNDISDTIISQAHNYFIHQLINQRDLSTIGNAVSYIDRITEESIPTLSVGVCVFSGIATPMPLKLKINELPAIKKPRSHTLEFNKVLGELL